MARLRSRTVYKAAQTGLHNTRSISGALLARMRPLRGSPVSRSTAAGWQRRIPECDQTSAIYRNCRFLRRSTITLVEFRGTPSAAFRERAVSRAEADLQRRAARSVERGGGILRQVPSAAQIGSQRLRWTFSALDRHGDRERSSRRRGRHSKSTLVSPATTRASSFDLPTISSRLRSHFQKPGEEELQPFVRMLFTSIQEGWGHVVKVMHAVSLSTVLRDFGF